LEKELKTLGDILKTRKVTQNQCFKNLLEYLFSPTDKPLFNKMVAVTRKIARMKEISPRKRKTLDVSVCPSQSRDFMLEK